MSGTILATARAISPSNSGGKSVTCNNWYQELLAGCDRPGLGVKGAQEECSSGWHIRRNWGPRGEKRLVSAFLGMGMSEATALQRLLAAGGAASLVVWCSPQFNNPEDDPSITLSLEQFVSEPSVKRVGLTGEQRERGSEAKWSAAQPAALSNMDYGENTSQQDRFQTPWTDTSSTKKNKQKALSCYNMASKEHMGIQLWMASRHLSGEIKSFLLLSKRKKLFLQLKLKADFSWVASAVLNHFFFFPRGLFPWSLPSRLQKLLPAPLSGCLATTHGPHLWQWSSQECHLLQGKGRGIYPLRAQ